MTRDRDVRSYNPEDIETTWTDNKILFMFLDEVLADVKVQSPENWESVFLDIALSTCSEDVIILYIEELITLDDTGISEVDCE